MPLDHVQLARLNRRATTATLLTVEDSKPREQSPPLLLERHHLANPLQRGAALTQRSCNQTTAVSFLGGLGLTPPLPAKVSTEPVKQPGAASKAIPHRQGNLEPLPAEDSDSIGPLTLAGANTEPVLAQPPLTKKTTKGDKQALPASHKTRASTQQNDEPHRLTTNFMRCSGLVSATEASTLLFLNESGQTAATTAGHSRAWDLWVTFLNQRLGEGDTDPDALMHHRTAQERGTLASRLSTDDLRQDPGSLIQSKG